MVFNVIKRNSTWMLIEKALTEPLKKKIPTDDFNGADSKGRIVILKDAFTRAILQAAGGQIEQNLHCFNANHDDKTPSMFFDVQSGHGYFHCFGCQNPGRNYDLFNAIEDYFDLEGFKACYEKAIELFVEEPEKVVSPQANHPYPIGMYKAMHNEHYTPINQSEEGIEYIKSRGIELKNAVKNALMVWEYQGCGYLVFINDNGSIVRRLIYKTDVAMTYASVPNKWWNSKGEGGFFGNERMIKSAAPKNEPIFVVESAMDALSAQELGYKAVGLNSCLKYGKFFKENPYQKYIVLMDNDDEGRNASMGAKEWGYYVVEFGEETAWPFLSEHKDLNEALVADSVKAKEELKKIVVEAKKYYKMKGVG